jgi:hypothetical protein
MRFRSNRYSAHFKGQTGRSLVKSWPDIETSGHQKSNFKRGVFSGITGKG